MNTIGYIAVNNMEGFDVLLDGADGFHDAILREAAFVARGYVDEHHQMWGDTDPADVVLFIQLQSHSRPGVELLLTGVTLCIVTTAATTMEPEIEFSSTGISLYLEGRSREGHFAPDRSWPVVSLSR